jgi:hypothetical protein
MSYSGKFTPKNPNKYVGDPNNIVYRSSWEKRCMSYFDRTDEIISWASEEISIPYRSPVDGKIHRYFPDFLIRVKTGDKTKTIMIEVKPYKQTQPPKQRSRVTKQYITEVTTWGVNQAKWKAAEEYCKDRNWEFSILSEIDLGIN